MTVPVALGWLVGWLLLWRLPRLDPPSATAPGSSGRRVSVVIPARNEVDRLPVLLASLRRQSRPADQIVVVDDGSSDGTGDAARSAGVEVLVAAPVPSGWTGKSWACATGAAAAGGAVLVFLDADVELTDDALAALLATHDHSGGLVSVQPHHHVRRPVEALSLPFNVVAMMGLGVGSVWPPRREWGAAGPCLVMGRRDYDRVGGHAAVAGAVAEDLELARCAVAEGIAVRCVAGAELIRFRMYRGLRELVRGWSKNVATGAGRTPALRALGIAVWVAALVAMTLQLASGPGDGPGAAAGQALVYAAGAVQLTLFGRQVGRFGAAGVLWPVLVAGFVAVFTLSVVRTVLFRQVIWSGRKISLRPQQ